MWKSFTFCSLLLFFFTFVLPLDASEPESFYGVCAHVANGPEFDTMPRNLELMQKAGIRWIRCDFSHWDLEGPRGNWHFEKIDRLIEETERYGIHVLPILNHPHHFANPPHEKTDAWLDYVEHLVRHCAPKIRYWEVMNEQNLSGDPEKAEHYAAVLKATYAKIKEIDPELQVLFTGTSHIPLDFIEKVFESGAAHSFDAMNVHPYRRGFTSMYELEKYAADVQKLRDLMTKYGVGEKPIWFTEIGWATAPDPFHLSRGILRAAKEILTKNGKKPAGKRWKIAVLCDDFYPSSASASFDALRKICPEEDFEPVAIRLTDLNEISPDGYDALIFPPSENYPSPFHAEIEKYVADGGVLFLLGGVPLYYTMNFEEGENRPRDLSEAKKTPQPLVRFRPFPGSREHAKNLRVDWRASWADFEKKAPESASVVLADETRELMESYAEEGAFPKTVGRFLGTRFLKDGDRMIPILMAERDEYRAPCVAVYDFRSDLKGAVVVSTLPVEFSANTLEDQAEFLPQAILLAQRFGIERFFWYEFQDSAGDETLAARRNHECHFGIVDHELNPKPAYEAYKALTAACPDGAEFDRELPWKNGSVVQIAWKRPDGVKVWAFWSPDGPQKVNVKIDGKMQKLQLTRTPVYIQGAN